MAGRRNGHIGNFQQPSLILHASSASARLVVILFINPAITHEPFSNHQSSSYPNVFFRLITDNQPSYCIKIPPHPKPSVVFAAALFIKLILLFIANHRNATCNLCKPQTNGSRYSQKIPPLRNFANELAAQRMVLERYMFKLINTSSSRVYIQHLSSIIMHGFFIGTYNTFLYITVQVFFLTLHTPTYFFRLYFFLALTLMEFIRR